MHVHFANDMQAIHYHSKQDRGATTSKQASTDSPLLTHKGAQKEVRDLTGYACNRMPRRIMHEDEQVLRGGHDVADGTVRDAGAAAVGASVCQKSNCQGNAPHAGPMMVQGLMARTAGVHTH